MVLDQLFVWFSRYWDVQAWHTERIVALMHQGRHRCTEYAELLCKETLGLQLKRLRRSTK
jgi:hypothetical protein